MTSDQARDLKHNGLWNELCEEVNAMVLSTKEALVTAKPEDVRELQEKAKALMTLINIPQNIIDREAD